MQVIGAVQRLPPLRIPLLQDHRVPPVLDADFVVGGFAETTFARLDAALEYMVDVMEAYKASISEFESILQVFFFSFCCVVNFFFFLQLFV